MISLLTRISEQMRISPFFDIKQRIAYRATDYKIGWPLTPLSPLTEGINAYVQQLCNFCMFQDIMTGSPVVMQRVSRCSHVRFVARWCRLNRRQRLFLYIFQELLFPALHTDPTPLFGRITIPL